MRDMQAHNPHEGQAGGGALQLAQPHEHSRGGHILIAVEEQTCLWDGQGEAQSMEASRRCPLREQITMLGSGAKFDPVRCTSAPPCRLEKLPPPQVRMVHAGWSSTKDGTGI